MNESDPSKDPKTIHRLIEAIKTLDDPRRLETITGNKARESRKRRNTDLVISLIFTLGMFVLLLLSWPWSGVGRDQWAGLIVGVWIGAALCIIQGIKDPTQRPPTGTNNAVVLRGFLLLLLMLFMGVLRGMARSLLSPTVITALADPQIQILASVAASSFLFTIGAYNSILIWWHRKR